MLTSHQLRAARAILGWTAKELAELAGIHITTVQRLEGANGLIGGNAATQEKIIGTLEASGIEFLSYNGRQGVVLRDPEQGRE